MTYEKLQRTHLGSVYFKLECAILFSFTMLLNCLSDFVKFDVGHISELGLQL